VLCPGAALVAAALVVGALNALSPFERGWWLASYLLLVGGASQVLLGGGQFLVAAERRAVSPTRSLSWTQLALWELCGTSARRPSPSPTWLECCRAWPPAVRS
jgi:hypothetical protein